MLIKQLIDLEKTRTDKLKFGTELQDQVIDGWSVTQWMIGQNFLQIVNQSSSCQH